MFDIIFGALYLALLLALVCIAYESLDDERSSYNYVEKKPGSYVTYVLAGRRQYEPLKVRGFKPEFSYDEQTKTLFFERADGVTFRVHVDEWTLTEVPEKEDIYAG